MRKQILLTAAVCALLCILTACGRTDNQTAPPEDSTPPQVLTESPQVPAEPPQDPASTEPQEVRPAAEKPPETAPEPVKGEEPAVPQAGGSAMLTAYANVLEEMRDRFAEWKNPGDQLSDNHFAVFDIDGDGVEELVTEFCTGPTAALEINIYGYDSQSGETFSELCESYGATVYDNGVIIVLASHNQGRAGENFWPYTIYLYDPLRDIYLKMTWVDAWDRQVADGADWGDVPFPAEVDEDDDGVVYYVITDGSYAPQADPVDGPAYEAWRESLLAGTARVEIPWQPLTDENINGLSAQ